MKVAETVKMMMLTIVIVSLMVMIYTNDDMVLHFPVQQKPKAKNWMYRLSPHELMHLLSTQMRWASREHSGESSSTDLELILTLDANNGDSSGDEDDDNDNSSQEDFVF